MRNVSGILLVLALLAVFMLPGMTRQSAAPQLAPQGTEWLPGSWPNSTGTPRAALPYFLMVPTLTPTITPTPTKTNTPVPATPTRTGVPGLSEWQGRMIWKEGRTQYYTHIEWIKFLMEIYNPTGQPKSFTILGVNVSGPFFYGNNSRFHTSWTGAPDWISAGCWGPNGHTDWTNFHRCSFNPGEGWHEDHIGDSSNVEIEQTGHYWVDF